MSVSALASTFGSAALSLGARARRAQAAGLPAATRTPARFPASGRSALARAKKGGGYDDYDDYDDYDSTTTTPRRSY